MEKLCGNAHYVGWITVTVYADMEKEQHQEDQFIYSSEATSQADMLYGMPFGYNKLGNQRL